MMLRRVFFCESVFGNTIGTIMWQGLSELINPEERNSFKTVSVGKL
jgi:hypothetical protein